MPHFEHGKIRIHYEVHEGLVERDTIAIHGNLASNRWWRPLIKALGTGGKKGDAAGGGRFITAEWRGCGKTTGLETEEDFDLTAMGEDYNALLRHLSASEAAVIAHSTGGPIALHAMLKAPSLYSRAILLDPVGATGVQFGPEMYAAFTAMSKSREMCEAVMTGTISKYVEDRDFLTGIVNDAFGVHPLVWHGVAKMLHVADFRASLPQIQQPVLVLHGENDQILQMEPSRALADALPHGRFMALPGRGHSTNIEDPALLAGLMREFLYG